MISFRNYCSITRVSPGCFKINPPIYANPRGLTPEKIKIAKTESYYVIKIWQPSKSPWASPLHMAPKKNDTSVETFVPFRDSYPIPNIQTFYQVLPGPEDYNLSYHTTYVWHRDVKITKRDISKKFSNDCMIQMFLVKMRYLGHLVTPNGILYLADKIEVIKNLPIKES